MEPITTRVAKIYLDEHGFIRVDGIRAPRNPTPTPSTLCPLMAQTGQGTRRPAIVNTTQMKAIDRETREHYLPAAM